MSANAASSALQCRGLTKDYGQGHGVFDLDLSITRGEVFGFVGPNGAGKTTTIRLLMDLVRPDRGSARCSVWARGGTAGRSSAGWVTCLASCPTTRG